MTQYYVSAAALSAGCNCEEAAGGAELEAPKKSNLEATPQIGDAVLSYTTYLLLCTILLAYKSEPACKSCDCELSASQIEEDMWQCLFTERRSALSKYLYDKCKECKLGSLLEPET